MYISPLDKGIIYMTRQDFFSLAKLCRLAAKVHVMASHAVKPKRQRKNISLDNRQEQNGMLLGLSSRRLGRFRLRDLRARLSFERISKSNMDGNRKRRLSYGNYSVSKLFFYPKLRCNAIRAGCAERSQKWQKLAQKTAPNLKTITMMVSRMSF